MMNDTDRIASLRETLHQHAHQYYVLNAPVITDEAYDTLFRELQDLEARHPELADANSPTSRVGRKTPNTFNKVKHDVPMMSLENSFTVEEAYKKLASEAGDCCDIILEPKVDGLSLSLRYVNGQLVKAVTRGDHEVGDDVTNNARTISGIPLTIPYTEPIEVRGEAYLSKANFLALNASLAAAGEELFANARNAAAGSLKQKDSTICASRKLGFIGYYVVSPLSHKLISQEGLLTWLQQLGFPIAYQNVASFGRIRLNTSVLAQYLEAFNVSRKSLPFDTDGCVIKINNLELQLKLGNKTRAPRWAAAFKYPAEAVTTKLERIDWQVGRTGKVTPVAILTPILCGGATVSRATLNNPDYIEKLNIEEGCMVEITRGGEVIPTVLRRIN